jgi:tight adherence protein B
MSAVVVAACVFVSALAARQAGVTRRRAGVLGRVSGDAPRRFDGVGPTRAALWREPPPAVVAALARTELSLDPTRAWRLWTRALMVAALLGLVAAGPVLGLIAAAGVVAAPLVAGAVLRRRVDAAYDATLAAALDAVARGVRSGGSLPLAVAEAATSVRGQVAADFDHIAAAVARGRSFVDALDDWRRGRERPSVRLTGGALVLATQTGGPPARVIEEVAAAIRIRQQVEREAHGLAAQARLSAMVVGLAPLGFMLVMCLTDPRNAHLLFGTPIGVGCLVAGLSLDAVGAAWMHRMSAAVGL